MLNPKQWAMVGPRAERGRVPEGSGDFTASPTFSLTLSNPSPEGSRFLMPNFMFYKLLLTAVIINACENHWSCSQEPSLYYDHNLNIHSISIV
jgi:hypothetical protein